MQADNSGMTPWQEGGLYSTPNEDGTYAVLKILQLDPEGVHLRLYGQALAERPTDVQIEALELCCPDQGPETDLGIGHLPIARSSFATWDLQYLKTVPVQAEELEGYQLWQEAGGGYF